MLNYQEIKSVFESKEQISQLINESMDEAKNAEARHATLFAAHHYHQNSHDVAANAMKNIGDSESETRHRNLAEIHRDHADRHKQAMDHINRYSDSARVHGTEDSAAKAHRATAMAKSKEAMESSRNTGMYLSGNTLRTPHGTVSLKSGPQVGYRHNVGQMMVEISNNIKRHKS